MHLITENEIQLDDGKLTKEQEQQILKSPNAMSAFTYDTTGMQALPKSTYLRLYKDSDFAGAVHLEAAEISPTVTIHPMLLVRDRKLFTEATEAAILWCINLQIIPTAQVADTDYYTYMHSFLDSLGMWWIKQGDWRLYRLPTIWKPKSFSTYTMDFES